MKMKQVLFLSVVMGLMLSPPLFAGQGDHDHAEEAHPHGEADGHDHTDEAHPPETAQGHDHEGEAHAHEEEHTDEHGDGHGHEGEHAHGHGETASEVELNETQRRLAGVETMQLERRSLGEAITSPGEVTLNLYRTTKVTPRIPAQVIARHVTLGDRVEKGQPLVTLSSVEMAEAQGALIEADVELRRVKRLGRKVVSEKRYVAAQIAYQQAYARVNAYGMTKAQIDALLREGNAARAVGKFQLLSFQEGTVINDDFVIGELVEPGHVLVEISDESVLWVKARLTPDDASRIALGAPAHIQVGERWIEGKVVQASHSLDETTRTLALHVEVPNPDDSLHPGQFVNVVMESDKKLEGLAVPVEAVLRGPDGDWQLFVESSPGHFEPKEVKVLRTVGNQLLIEGVDEGATIVAKGAFFVQSEMAKGGFDPHNH